MRSIEFNPAAWRERVRALLNEQIDLYASLDALSERQAELICAENPDGLLDVLTQRQRVMDRAKRVAEDLSPYRERWGEFVDALPAFERDALNAKVREAADLVDVIAARDERDRRAMEEQRAQIATRLREVTHARGAVAAYAGSSKASPDARFQDREG